VISGLIKVEASMLITLTENLFISGISQKTNLILVLLYIVLKKITRNALSHQTQFTFDKPCSYVNLTLLLEILHSTSSLWIIHLSAGR